MVDQFHVIMHMFMGTAIRKRKIGRTVCASKSYIVVESWVTDIIERRKRERGGEVEGIIFWFATMVVF